MFRANSPYSPFFTSGLLSEPISARKDKESLYPDDQSAIYFDVVFSDDDEYRSFLSLDLAETQSYRSLSIKRKSSSKKSKPRYSPIPETPSLLRSRPSPKPVPSIIPPPPPSRSTRPPISTAPPRLPSLPPLPSLDLDISPIRKSTPPKRQSNKSSAQPSVRSPTRQPSTVSSNTRTRNRATALALLEGRQKPVVPAPPRPPRELKNFMSMSDDEDDDGEDDVLPQSDSEEDPTHFFNPTFEPEDIVLPVSPTTHSFPPSRLPRASSADKLGGRKASQRRNKHKSAKASEWFPLKSFIDLYNDNDDESRNSGWNWRSFIEVSNVS